MIKYLKPDYWQIILRDPITWLALAVDFVPVYMVFAYGWGASELVLLYWAENILIGLAVWVRILLSGVRFLGGLGVFLSLFLAAFFTFHYGMFCFGHGVFVFSFAEGLESQIGGPSPQTLINMMEAVRSYAPGMTLMFMLIMTFQIVAAVKDYWPQQGKTYASPMEEMMSPYGRIVVLHIAIFAGAFAMALLGDPMVGVLGLILLRMAFSVIGRNWRESRQEGKAAEGESATQPWPFSK